MQQSLLLSATSNGRAGEFYGNPVKRFAGKQTTVFSLTQESQKLVVGNI